MGAHFAVDLAEGISIEKFRVAYRGRLLAADARGGVNLFEAPDYTAAGPICWLMGAEGPGLSVKALELADERYYSVFINHETLDEILSILEQNGDMKHRREGEMIHLYKK